MGLTIETFSNVTGGNSFFKAVSHPLAADAARALVARLEAAGPVAVYDPFGMAEGFAEFHDLGGVRLDQVFVQNIEHLGNTVLGCTTEPVTSLAESAANLILVAAFDADRAVRQIRHLMPAGAEVVSLDAMRMDEVFQTNRDRYLDPGNFATNFAFFRDRDGHHTSLASANYWAGYGAGNAVLHLVLFDEGGAVLAQWDEPMTAGINAIAIDSRQVRERFGLGPFTGQLFLHVAGGAGHDVVKYALDIFSDDERSLSCSHDANAWPAELYAGLPAPAEDEDVVLWIQNSHPCPIPAGAVGLNLMGRDDITWLEREVPPFGTVALSVAELLPAARWPQQIEVRAGKYLVRPRYEVIPRNGPRRIAHMNVERVDLKCDPAIPDLANLMGKGYILPAPVLPTERWRSLALPTPMSTCQDDLPVAVLVIDASGQEVARHRFGRLARDHAQALDIGDALNGSGLPSGYGHMELIYDFSEGGAADGWLHGLFRYEDRASGHAADTSFGAHMFNTVLTYRGEPQSYAGAAPGLSTRLFLRLGPAPLDTMCHLIYPASTPWHGTSATQLTLHDAAGRVVAEHGLEIPCSGSRLWRYSETFTAAERTRAGDPGAPGAYVMITDATCRLFGYHGLLDGNGAFSLDHMFGF